MVSKSDPEVQRVCLYASELFPNLSSVCW